MNINENFIAKRFEEFQPFPTYAEPARRPKTVVSQTDSILDLYGARIINPDIAKDYLRSYTLPFLKTAAEGAPAVFEGKSLTPTVSGLSSDVKEAANFTNIVFAWMHYFAQSELIPGGFTRNGTC